ncbi:MAG: aquaporin [Armatimonadota bacterium]|nr:aquaporin [Armatimonadota bacterium]
MRYLYELIGAFFLVFTVGMVVLQPGVPDGFAPLAIGAALAVMVFAGGHISGGHYNPAVSLAVFARGRLAAKDMVIYWVAQLAGAFIAAMVALFLKGKGATPPAFDTTRAFIAEFVFTFALCYVVLNAATAKATERNSYYGWAIGTTVMVGAYAVGGISGGAFNPAVTVGGLFMGLFTGSGLLAYFVAQFAGGYAAALVFRAAHPGE